MIACSCVLLLLILLHKVPQISPKNGFQIANSRVNLLFSHFFPKFIVIYLSADIRKPKNSKFWWNYFPPSKHCGSLPQLANF